MLNAISNGNLASNWAPKVSAAAIAAGLPPTSVEPLLGALAYGEGFEAVPGLTPAALGAAADVSEHVYAHAYNLAWWSIVPFVVLAIVAVAFLKGVKELMTERVEATVEDVQDSDVDKLKA